MKALKALSVIAFALPLMAAQSNYQERDKVPTYVSTATSPAPSKQTTITIDESTIVFRGEVNGELVSKTISQMYLSKKDTITIFIDSPGGSVVSGMYLANVIKNFHKPTVCVVSFAASMAFAITQACTERYVMASSVMMQHQMSMGVENNLGKMQEMVRFGTTLSHEGNKFQADRIGMSEDAFATRVMNDWWLFGKEAVKENVADKVVHTECALPLVDKKVEEEVQVFIFKVKIVWSACPLINYPLEIKMGGDSEKDKAKVKSLLNDRTLYLRELRGQ